MTQPQGDAAERARMDVLRNSWRDILKATFPVNVADPLPAIAMVLPSDYSLVQRRALRLEKLAFVELKARTECAKEQIRQLKNALREKSCYEYEVKQQTRNAEAPTRKGHGLEAARERVKFWRNEYTANRSIMQCLGLAPDTPFTEIRDEDLYRENTVAPHDLSSGKLRIGWIWTVGTGAQADGVLPAWEEEGK